LFVVHDGVCVCDDLDRQLKPAADGGLVVGAGFSKARRRWRGRRRRRGRARRRRK